MSAFLGVCLVVTAIWAVVLRQNLVKARKEQDRLRAALAARCEAYVLQKTALAMATQSGRELAVLAREFKSSSELWRRTCIDMAKRLDPVNGEELARQAAELDAEAALTHIMTAARMQT